MQVTQPVTGAESREQGGGEEGGKNGSPSPHGDLSPVLPPPLILCRCEMEPVSGVQITTVQQGPDPLPVVQSLEQKRL